MNWDDLKIFLCVARRRKLADAARELKLDETTVSRRLKRLEDALGHRLFERLRSGPEEIELQTAIIQAQQSPHSQSPSGAIRISVAEGFGVFVLSPCLGEFHKNYPQIEIDLVAGSGFLSLSRLAEHLLIDYVDDLIYAEELRYFETALPQLKPGLRSTSITAQRNLVKDGSGLAILPDFMTDKSLEKILPGQISLSRQFWFSVHKTIAPLAKIQAFKAFIFEHISNTKVV